MMDNIYKETMTIIVKVMNNPGHNIYKKLAVKDKIVSRQSE